MRPASSYTSRRQSGLHREAQLDEHNGKHYPRAAVGLNSSWSVEDITHYMSNLAEDVEGKIKTAKPFHPSEFPVLHAIYDFVKSWQLSCSGPDSAFGFPD